jgi:hypothetical protein
MKFTEAGKGHKDTISKMAPSLEQNNGGNGQGDDRKAGKLTFILNFIIQTYVSKA